MKTRHLVVLAGALLLGTPALMTLPGCGGGNSGLVSGDQNLNGLSVALGNTQVGELDLAISGRNVSSVLRINPAAGTPEAADTIETRAFTTIIPAGVYTGTGTIDSAGEFRVVFAPQISGNRLVISGQVPRTTQAGSYVISLGSQSQEGIFPALNTPAPTATPTALPTQIG